MRIQHNIMSMNAYRNYNNNTSALSKNLEKLSSGYKINRAGDDAAGLAISEKMRAQIQGLNAAQKNVKDGISLVKTAEGAMQEIQDMLSRMKYLATQSANGTYDDDVDRKALQDEVDQLNSEINRIADSANFNGTKLLDGSLSGASSGPATVTASYGGTAAALAAGKKHNFSFTVGTAVDNKDYELSFEYVDEAGAKKTANIKVAGTVGTKGAIASAVKDELQKIVGDNFTVSVATNNKFTIKAVATGATQFHGIVAESKIDGAVKRGGMNVATEGADDSWQVALNGKKASAGDAFVINGETFEIVKHGNKAQNSGAKALYVDANTLTADSVASVVEQLKSYGVNAAVNGTTKTTIDLYAGGNGGGLQLQIGDTADSYNQLMVVVGDLHADAIGVGKVDISSIDGAAASIESIKNAINTVSSIRGRLGATQNRLEHTQNNLSVMTENIQDAESTIRDTDVADEMMAYTKNNILIQSAQAMLAQANAVPQGVLQLLG